ncbi:hypothetical protein KBD20_04710, partial [Candidatus Saccharibacteria bacterium]|nr:hypothetical protein [Candidatus Saccharibacteria bacterium]
PYIGIGEGLFDTSAVDGIVISDALAESSEPCGNSQSTIRFAYADLIASNREVHNAEAAVTRTKLNEADFKERIADDADFSGAKAGGVFGLVVGVIAGLVVTRRKSEVDSTHPVQRTPVQRIEVTSDTPAVAPFLKAMSKPD